MIYYLQAITNRLYYGDNLDILRSRDYFPDSAQSLEDRLLAIVSTLQYIA